MRPFEYASPTRIDGVLPQLGRDGEVRPLAGGTDLITLMKADVAAPMRLLDIKRLEEMSSRIEETGDGLTLGALTTLSDIERSPLLQQRYSALAEAAAVAATPQLRNMATLGGNLLQRPRCWYFRSPRFHCWLKGGERCDARDGENQLHALFGGGPCYAVHPSDIAPALLALDAEVRLRGRTGERTLPVGEFFVLPAADRRIETAIRADELITAVRLPPPPENVRSTYLKAMDRKIWAFALVGVAAALRMGGPDGRRIEDARLVLSGVAPIPWRAQRAESLLIGNEADVELFARAADTALQGAEPLNNNHYKAPLARSLVRRALSDLAWRSQTTPR